MTTIETALGKSIDELFAAFDTQALASASIAQVHTATLHSNIDVVVKVVRPGIERTISADVRLLQTLARLVERHIPDGRRLRPVEVVEDYRHTIFDELDLKREGANTSQLRRNFKDSEILYVPEVYWDYTRRNVLVMERIHGIPVTDVATLREQGTDMKKLAERGVEIFFTQVFRDSFFHADMHPGNIFIAHNRPSSPQYIAIDCAIIGSLSDFDQYYLARNLLAIFQRNYREVAELHVECGWVPPETKIHEFEAAIRSVSEPIFEKPSQKFPSANYYCICFKLPGALTWKFSHRWYFYKNLIKHRGLGQAALPPIRFMVYCHAIPRALGSRPLFAAKHAQTRQSSPAGVVRTTAESTRNLARARRSEQTQHAK